MCLKTNLTCRYCSKIFKEPVSMPCGHTICKEHLSESNVVQKDLVKCDSCSEEFNLSKTKFNSNYVAQSIIDDEDYLSHEEKCFKMEIKDSCLELHQLNEKLKEKRKEFLTFNTEIHQHFQEIERQIESHREKKCFDENRDIIDKYALDLIKRTKSYEEFYSKSINKVIESCLLFEIVPIDVNEETRKCFRDPKSSFDNAKKRFKWEQETKMFTIE